MTTSISPDIFRSYDIRGIFNDDLTPAVGYQVALAYAQKFQPKRVVVGQDVRPASGQIKAEIIRGLVESGVEVFDIGMIASDMLYFAVGHYGYDGGIVASASHNPAEYAGIKITKQEAQPVFAENGLFDLRDMIIDGPLTSPGKQGSVTEQDIWDEYLNFVTSFVDLSAITQFHLAANANFGMNGVILDKLIAHSNLPLQVSKLNYDPDGTFPKGRPDPLRPENRGELLELTQTSGADFGVAWDGDGDRVFFCDNQGNFYNPSYLSAIFIEQFLGKQPGATFLYDTRYVYAARAAAEEHSGTAFQVKVGHSYIKDRMRKEQAVFCGESSGHFYFRDNWYADNGMIPLLMVLELLSKRQTDLQTLLQSYTSRFFISGEHNFTVADRDAALETVKQHYADGQLDDSDGVAVAYDNWRFSLRVSATEPLVRLNVESTDQQLVDEKLAEIKQLLTT